MFRLKIVTTSMMLETRQAAQYIGLISAILPTVIFKLIIKNLTSSQNSDIIYIEEKE
jgi:hypothetical protein